MCGRYYIPDEDSAAELKEIIDQINRRHNAGPVLKTGEIVLLIQLQFWPTTEA